MHMDISQEPFCVEIYRKSAVRQSRDTRFVRACAVERHMDMSQEPFCVEIYRENAGRVWEHLDETPGLSCNRKNPASVATLFGEYGTTVRTCKNGMENDHYRIILLSPINYNIMSCHEPFTPNRVADSLLLWRIAFRISLEERCVIDHGFVVWTLLSHPSYRCCGTSSFNRLYHVIAWSDSSSRPVVSCLWWDWEFELPPEGSLGYHPYMVSNSKVTIILWY